MFFIPSPIFYKNLFKIMLILPGPFGLFYKLITSYLILEYLNKEILNFDYVVVGSGPGGTTSAKIISENTNTSIAVIEEGIENDEKIEMGTHEDLSKRYRYGGAELIFSTPNISIAEGRGFGGGSEINSGIYHRIQDQVIQNWSEKFKIEDLTNSSLDEHYKFIEKWLKVEKTGKNLKAYLKS